MKAITTMITAALNERSSAEKREIFPRFFKTGQVHGRHCAQCESRCEVA